MSAAKNDEDVGEASVGTQLSAVMSDLDRLRMKLERLRDVAVKRSSERRLKIPAKRDKPEG